MQGKEDDFDSEINVDDDQTCKVICEDWEFAE